MKIEVVDNHSARYPLLHNFVNKHGLLFNSAAWLGNYNHKNTIQCCILNKNGDIIGCFIYYRFSKLGFNFIITPPYSPNIELFYENPAESVVGINSFNKDVSDLLADYFKSLKAQYINLNLPDAIVDTQPFTWKGYTARSRYSYLIDLSLPVETLSANLSSEKRKSINKAAKDGLVVKGTSDYKLVYELAIKSLARSGKDKNTDILRNILFAFANGSNSFAFVAYQGEQALGACFCLIEGKKALYLFGGFDSENKHHGAGVSCMWNCILKSKELGLSHFDFEGSMNPSIERYFREFGGKLSPYFCVERTSPVARLLFALRGQVNV